MSIKIRKTLFGGRLKFNNQLYTESIILQVEINETKSECKILTTIHDKETVIDVPFDFDTIAAPYLINAIKEKTSLVKLAAFDTMISEIVASQIIENFYQTINTLAKEIADAIQDKKLLPDEYDLFVSFIPDFLAFVDSFNKYRDEPLLVYGE